MDVRCSTFAFPLLFTFLDGHAETMAWEPTWDALGSVGTNTITMWRQRFGDDLDPDQP